MPVDSKRLRPLRWGLAGLVGVALAGAGAYAVSQSRRDGEAPALSKAASAAPAGASAPGRSAEGRPIPVLTATAKESDVRIVLNAIGTVQAARTVNLRSRVGGQLDRVLFSEGQAVKAGELLAELDRRPFEALLSQAQGQAVRNQALLKNAELDLARYNGLRQQDSIATQQVDAQEALVQQLRGTVLADQGLVDQARLQLAYTRITAPFAGRIGLRQVDAGNNVNANDAVPLAVLHVVQPIMAVFAIPEDAANGIAQKLAAARKAGQALQVEAWDKGHRRSLATGRLLTLDNQVDAASGTVRLKAEFANEDGTLLPNQFVNVRLQVETRRQVTTVPSVAIQRGSAGPFVYVVGADQTVSVRPVSTGTVEADQIVVERNLSVGEVVVVNGTDRLREGAKVASSARGERGERGERQRTAQN